MRQSIMVKMLPATETKPTRLKATAQAGSLTISYDYEGMNRAAEMAAYELAKRMEWPGKWYGGCLPGSVLSWCFVQAEHDSHSFEVMNVHDAAAAS